ncbi:Ephrin type-A receptor 4-B [Geodia barretti]|uniref:Ephrin type-A receptor 4-B n=1 Tax=Geodia barretti TaxID=519541 RepID=A0AA35STI6_GEOBA|nr:Ephrin type-A receptor 4-B [Geodia barretti]
MYLALVDLGTCVFVHRVLVFYNGALCSGEQTGLIQHPEVLPPRNRVVGKCVANSSTLDGLDPALQCTDEGHWRVLTPCLCGPGFELTVVNGDASCTECPRGTYSAGLSNSSCLPCPANSIIPDSELGLSTQCPCINGYFKAPTDTYSEPCTRSPSAPRNLTVSNVTNTSAVLSWSPPDNGGGRPLYEIFYTVYTYYNGSLATMELVVNSTETIVTGLTPGVLYTFSVSAENDVSSQDNNINARSLSTTATTLYRVPSSVWDIQEHCTVILWKTPAETHGSIIGYLLTFQKGEQSTDVYVVDPTYHYHVIQPSDIPPGTGKVSVEVRARNILGLSQHLERKLAICKVKGNVKVLAKE